MSAMQQMKQARKHIKASEFDEAREILVDVDHPKAREWLSKLDDMHPPLAITKTKRKNIQTSERAQMKQARRLIKQKRYEQARDILEQIDNPTARRWLEKLEDIDMFTPEPPAQPAGAMPYTQVTVNHGGDGAGCLVQGLWFIFVGWYLGAIWVSLAWFVMLTVLGIPLAIWMINRVPKVLALRSPGNKTVVTTSGGNTTVEVNAGTSQRSFLIRAIYFVLIGWWFSGIWMSLAYTISMTIIGLPLGFWMFDKTPGILTLQRS